MAEAYGSSGDAQYIDEGAMAYFLADPGSAMDRRISALVLYRNSSRHYPEGNVRCDKMDRDEELAFYARTASGDSPFASYIAGISDTVACSRASARTCDRIF